MFFSDASRCKDQGADDFHNVGSNRWKKVKVSGSQCPPNPDLTPYTLPVSFVEWEVWLSHSVYLNNQ